MPPKFRFLKFFAVMAFATVALAAQPVINSHGVVNASGYQSMLAPGAIFAVFGTGLGPQEIATSPTLNYPLVLAGTSVQLTAETGGAPLSARLVYTSTSQIAGMLPSEIAPGVYTLQVSYNGLTSEPQNVRVTARSLGIATSDSSGWGNPTATIANINGGRSLVRFTSKAVARNGVDYIFSPAHPGDIVQLWGTGGGADPLNDAGGSSGDQTVAGNFRVHLGSRDVTPTYAGTSEGYPGLWQVNFTVPADFEPACFNDLTVAAGGEGSNLVNLPVAAAGQSFCPDSQLSEAALRKFDTGEPIIYTGIGLERYSEGGTLVFDPQSNTPQQPGAPRDSAGGVVSALTVRDWILDQAGGIRTGACVVRSRSYPFPSAGRGGGSGLDLGPQFLVTGPNLGQGVNVALVTGSNYHASLPAQTLTGSTYTLTAPGGNPVGPFSATIDFPIVFVITGGAFPSELHRTQPLTFDWLAIGADQISISTGSLWLEEGTARVVRIVCTLPATAHTFTIPAEVLSHLDPGPAYFEVRAENTKSFQAPLTSGGQLDVGLVSAAVTYGRTGVVIK